MKTQVCIIGGGPSGLMLSQYTADTLIVEQRILSTPASRAAPITFSGDSGQRETCECESIKFGYARKP